MKHIGAALLFVLDMFTMMVLAILFGLVFIGAQIANWTGRES